jgi:hypothetical protein
VQDKVQDNCPETPINKGKVQDKQDKTIFLIIYKRSATLFAGWHSPRCQEDGDDDCFRRFHISGTKIRKTSEYIN